MSLLGFEPRQSVELHRELKQCSFLLWSGDAFREKCTGHWSTDNSYAHTPLQQRVLNDYRRQLVPKKIYPTSTRPLTPPPLRDLIQSNITRWSGGTLFNSKGASRAMWGFELSGDKLSSGLLSKRKPVANDELSRLQLMQCSKVTLNNDQLKSWRTSAF